MIGKAVKYGKVVALVVMVIILIYLVSVSSIFTGDSDNPITDPVTSDYAFEVQIYQDNSFLLEMTSGSNLTNASVVIEHNPALDPSHTTEQEVREISLRGSNNLKVIETISSESITRITVSDSNGDVLYDKSFAPENAEVEFQTGDENIQLADLQDQTIKIDESLDKNAMTIDGSNYVAGRQNVEYEWSMGDGTVYREANISHTYDEIGTYEVTLTVNAGSYQETESFNVTVEVQDAIESIVAPERAEVGEEVTFNGEESTTRQADRVEWFIDGERYTELNPTVSFDERGVYSVTLTVQDRSGESELRRTTILIINQDS